MKLRTKHPTVTLVNLPYKEIHKAHMQNLNFSYGIHLVSALVTAMMVARDEPKSKLQTVSETTSIFSDNLQFKLALVSSLLWIFSCYFIIWVCCSHLSNLVSGLPNTPHWVWGHNTHLNFVLLWKLLRSWPQCSLMGPLWICLHIDLLAFIQGISSFSFFPMK